MRLYTKPSLILEDTILHVILYRSISYDKKVKFKILNTINEGVDMYVFVFNSVNKDACDTLGTC